LRSSPRYPKKRSAAAPGATLILIRLEGELDGGPGGGIGVDPGLRLGEEVI
jgi:hypothetical protein